MAALGTAWVRTQIGCDAVGLPIGKAITGNHVQGKQGLIESFKRIEHHAQIRFGMSCLIARHPALLDAALRLRHR
ncbi:MAG: hypothetical protein EBW56_07185 [Burkholderiaceae bacterium]|nr:hypothetical protein [Burkholderiaceae bacterium]